MALWGTEINQRRPYTLHGTKGRRLRITQATLGLNSNSGSTPKKLVIFCKIGNNEPIRICILIPGTAESQNLCLEFQEDDEIEFSVSGSGNLYLIGYYIGQADKLRGTEDSEETHGEDIGEADSKESNTEDTYDYSDSFINDGDVGKLTPSPKFKKKGKKKRISRQRRLFKHELNKSDDEQHVDYSNCKSSSKKGKGIITLDNDNNDDQATIRSLIKH